MNTEEKILVMLEKMDSRLERLEEDVSALTSDMGAVKGQVEFIADVIEGTIKMVDELDQKYKAI